MRPVQGACAPLRHEMTYQATSLVRKMRYSRTSLNTKSNGQSTEKRWEKSIIQRLHQTRKFGITSAIVKYHDIEQWHELNTRLLELLQTCHSFMALGYGKNLIGSSMNILSPLNSFRFSLHYLGGAVLSVYKKVELNFYSWGECALIGCL